MESGVKFKVFSVPVTADHEILEECVGIINSKFQREHFHLVISNDEITVFLNILDLEKLRAIASDLETEYSMEKGNALSIMVERIASIGSYGIKAGKRSFVQYNLERKVRDRKKKIQDRGSYYYARNSKFAMSSNPFPEDLLDTITVADSEEAMRNIPDNSVDLVFTSPPYNFGLDYGEHMDGIDWNRYFEKLFSVLGECIRVTKYGGRVVINVQPLYSDFIPIHHMISEFFMKNQMIWRNEIIWEKNNYNAKYTAWGSWKSPSNPYLKYTWEFVEVFSKGDLKHPGDRNYADISDKEFKEWVNARWSISPERNMKEYDHPAMFPEKLAERVLKLFSFQNDIILDPFNGVGTTTKVAKKLKRHFVGFDVSEKYVETARKRLSEVDSHNL
jgi:DNA modification methylase